MYDQLIIDNNHPVFKNHTMQGQQLLPGLAYIDLIYQIFREHSYDYARLTLRNVMIYQPLTVGQDYSVALSIQCDEMTQGRWSIKVEGQSLPASGPEGPKKLYITAEMQLADITKFSERLYLDHLKQAITESRDLQEIYALCRQRELVHTKFMLAEGTVLRTDSSVLIDLALGAHALASAEGFMFHPTLIDGSAIGATVLFSDLIHKGQLFLPISYESFRASELIQNHCITRVQKPSVRIQNEILYMTMEFFDSTGQKIAELSKYAGKLVRDTNGVKNIRDVKTVRDRGENGHDEMLSRELALETLLQSLLAKQLRRTVEEISTQCGYYEMGLNSLGLIEVVKSLEKQFGVSLPPTLLFEYTTIAKLAAYLAQRLPLPMWSSTRATQQSEQDSNQTSIIGRYLEKEEGSSVGEWASNRPGSQLTAFSLGDNPTVPRGQGQSLAPGDSQRPPSEREEDGAIAIIGMAGRYPDADNLQSFWQNLVQGKDSITTVPTSRWDWQQFAGIKSPSGKDISRWGGFIKDPARFDPLFFRISPREAERMDPQERLFLETCWETIEDAGYTPATLVVAQGEHQRRRVGVFVGVMHKDYALLGMEAVARGYVFPFSLIVAPIANRVSYFCNFHGPSMVIDTLCSSSLTAVHHALESIKRGECEVALAGGVNLALHASKYLSDGIADIHASDGRCRTFGKGGDGYVAGEGCGAILLKPLQKAIRDGDHIYAVIKGSVINHGGAVSGISVPSPIGQADAILTCLEKSGVNPRTISYVEAHGTGTFLGDPIEIQGLTNAFHCYTQEQQFCAIGSVKSNIGHAESAAGISGLHKVILQLHHKMLVPSLHAEELNPLIDFQHSPFFVQRRTEFWQQPVLVEGQQEKVYPRRAGISSFGATGSNAHLILEEFVEETGDRKGRVGASPTSTLRHVESKYRGVDDGFTPSRALRSPGAHHVPAPTLAPMGQQGFHSVLVPLSAKNQERLRAYAHKLAPFLESQMTEIVSSKQAKEGVAQEMYLRQVAYTLQVGREGMEERVVFVVRHLAELITKLYDFARGQDDIDHCWRGQVKANQRPTLMALADQDFMQLLQDWIAKGELGKIAELWVNNYPLVWKSLYTGSTPQRVSLPTYPFAAEHYWIPVTHTQQASPQKGEVKLLSPLVHENTSDLEAQRFSSTFTGEEIFLADHVIQGQRMLPGVAYLEMARFAVQQAASALLAGQETIQMKHITWMQPLSVGASAIKVHTELTLADNGTLSYTISSESTGPYAVTTLHNQGEVEFGLPAEVEPLDLAALQTQCHLGIMQASTCYEIFQAAGLHYGPAYRCIETIYIGQGQALAKLSLPVALSDTAGQYVLHPSIMDAALLASVGVLMGMKDAHFPDRIVQPLIPFALEKLIIYRRCAPAMWAYIRFSTARSAGDTIRKLDIDICDSQGSVCVHLQELALRAYTETSGEIEGEDVVGTLVGPVLLYPAWDIVAPAQECVVTAKTEQIVVIGGTKQSREAIQRYYRQAQVVEASSQHPLEALIGQCSADGGVDHIIWIAPYQPLVSVHEETCIHEQKQGVFQCLHTIKTLLHSGYSERQLRWSIITTQAQPVHPTDRINPGYASIHGLVGSMAKEYPNWSIQLIDLAADGVYPVEEMFALPRDRQSHPWVYRNQHWYRQKLIPLAEFPVSQILYRHGGVYVVIGGAGGVGAIWSEYMIRTYQARIVWIGRRPMNATLQAKRDRLASAGHVPEYIVADATNYAELQQAYREIKQCYTSIHGVVHSAMVLQERSLADMDDVDFQAVLAAKVDISVRIAQVFRQEELDFVLFFSSLMSITRAPHQSNYSAGCTFVDAFAHRLAQEWSCAVKVMDWGYWKSNEIVENYRSMEQAYSPLAEIGIGLIEPPEAMRALEMLLSGPFTQIGLTKTTRPVAIESMDTTQVVVVEGKRIVRQHRQMHASPSLHVNWFPQRERRDRLKRAANGPEGDEVLELLREGCRAYLKRIVGETLKLSPHALDSSVPLENYGINSIMIVRMTNVLRNVFDPVSGTLFFEYQTIDALVEHFLVTQRDVLMALCGIEEKGESQEISEDDASSLQTAALHADPRGQAQGAAPTKGQRFLVTTQQGRAQHLPLASNQDRAQHPTSPDSDASRTPEIAIIGLSGRFPMASNVRVFWDNLKNGRNCISEIPAERWRWQHYFDEEKGKRGRIYTKWGGFIADIDKFDPFFFQIAPHEAEQMDPQERLFLEEAYASIEDAGYTPSSLSKSRKVGVFVGVMNGYYSSGASYWSIANRLSYLLNFQGPSLAVDTACSSSLAAIHLALESLYSGSCECAIAGGVNLIVDPLHYIKLSGATMLSATDRCRAFGEGADGFVDGEAVGAVVLKPLHRAEADGDHIYAVIKGSMLNAGGKTNGYTVPNPLAQAQVITDALHRAGVHARAVSYLEAHGTGTALGDPIEITGLTHAFRQHTDDRQFCALGSVKSGIGHCESAAGISGLTKILLQMQHRQLVPSLHAQDLNSSIDLSVTPFSLQQELTDWPCPVVEIDGRAREYPRIAGLSSFGAGGANVHMIIAEYDLATSSTASFNFTSLNPAIVVLSAKDGDRLRERAQQLLIALDEWDFSEGDLADIAYTLQIGREALEERLALTASSIKELKEKLSTYLAGNQDIDGFYRGQVKNHRDTIALLNGEDMTSIIETWIAKGKYANLLGLWVKGLTFDWSALYHNPNRRDSGLPLSVRRPRRISLPTYPFAKESYWMKSTRQIVGTGDGAYPHLPKYAGIASDRQGGWGLPPSGEGTSPNGSEQQSVDKPPANGEAYPRPSNGRGVDEGLAPSQPLRSPVPDASPIPDRDEAKLLAPIWDLVAIDNISPPLARNTASAIICTDREKRELIQEYCPTSSILYLRPADSVDEMVQKIKAIGSVDHVIWVAPDQTAISPTDEVLIEEQECGVFLLFRFLKALLRLGYGEKELRWTLITSQSQRVLSHETVAPAHASLHGFVGSMTKEYAHWQVCLVDLPVGQLWPLQEILTLSPADGQGNAWAYREGNWYQQRLLPVVRKGQSGSRYRRGGVYIVIGGAGGIGSVWTEYVIREYGAHVVWVGRREENEEIRDKSRKLGMYGPEPVYMQADAAEREELEGVVQQIKRRYGRIDGVVQAAIVLEDKSLGRMEEESMRRVLRAKVDVSVRVGQVFAGEELDFVVFFSSINAFIKAAGQSNYAAGSTFEDAYGQCLSGKWGDMVKVMNWGYWGSVGVVAGEGYRERLRKQGLGSIEANEGMLALEELLAGPLYQLAFIKATKSFALHGAWEEITVLPEQDPLPVESIKNQVQHVVQKKPLPTPLYLVSPHNGDSQHAASLNRRT